MPQLRYGNSRLFELDGLSSAAITDFSNLPGSPLDDPAAAITAALADPLEFPALTLATVPGDRIVLAVGHGVPRLADVLAGVTEALLAGSTRAEDITILLADDGDAAPGVDAISRLPKDVAAQIQVVHHDPADQSSLAYLAASGDNRPIYINRKVVDADLVLPIGCIRPSESLGYVGVYDALFPTFSDQPTLQRYRSPDSAISTVQHRRRRDEAKEAVWKLGVQITLQILPGPGDTILQVLAGDLDAVGRRGQQLCEHAWTHCISQPVALVIAAIEGAPSEQNWECFARALRVCLSVVEEHGAIVLCTDLACQPGPALQRLTGTEDESSLALQIRRERSPDAVSAALLLEARNRSTVFLLSALDEAIVEDLGIGFIEGHAELNHLSRQYSSCLLLADAHRQVVHLVAD